MGIDSIWIVLSAMSEVREPELAGGSPGQKNIVVSGKREAFMGGWLLTATLFRGIPPHRSQMRSFPG